VTRPTDASSPQPAPSTRVLTLPGTLALAVAAFALLTANVVLRRTFVAAGAVMLVWCAVLWFSARRANRSLAISVVVRRQHWVQACAQLTLILYWASHTPLVAAFLPFILAELVFAYAVDSLLSWSRRDVYTLGFGPFPVIFSISLFMLFKPQWFVFQLLLIVLGFAAKELIRWNREGRSVHIFNPSSFPLAVVSLILLATGTTDATFGNVIANTIFDTPHIHLVIFLVALPGMLLFGVARTTIAAALTLYAIGLVYFAATGTYLFYDAYIPPAVLIGMTLLVTDPSTSPRTDLGRLLFGALYAIGTAVLYVVLERVGAPTFYDKLLPVPLLNLMVRALDRIASARPFAAFDPARLLGDGPSMRKHAVYTSLWVVAFIGLSSLGAVGDKHPGEYLPFWNRTCDGGSARACRYAETMRVVYCQRGSGWACNDLGVLRRRSGSAAEREFQRACDLGFAPGCENIARAAGPADSLASEAPALRDLPIVLSGSKRRLRERDPAKLYALACEQGWREVCDAQASTAR
jgi:hypothetical protein